MTREVRIFPDIPAIAAAAAEEFVRLAPKTVALAGGSTPRALYQLLAARKDIAWDQIQFFWGDERHVPPDHPDSNYRMAHESLFAHVPVPEANIHRIQAENPLAAGAAADYAAEMRRVFGTALPRFDLVLLGMGPDGHTASLFPGTTALAEREKWVVSTWVEKMHSDRITMTLPVLNNAANIIFMAGGLEKAEVLKPVLSDSVEKTYPSQFIEPVNGRLLWMVDQAAAKLL
jgi:6-phosphogluconolactonase